MRRSDVGSTLHLCVLSVSSVFSRTPMGSLTRRRRGQYQDPAQWVTAARLWQRV